MGARVLVVKASPEDITPNRPQKPVRGRAARIAAYRAARRSTPAEDPAQPRKAAVEVVEERTPTPAPPPSAHTSPVGDPEIVLEQTYWPARTPYYAPRDTIPYRLEQEYK